LDYVQKIYQADEHKYVKNINLVKDTQKLFDMIVSLMAPVVNSSKDPWK